MLNLVVLFLKEMSRIESVYLVVRTMRQFCLAVWHVSDKRSKKLWR